MILKRTQFRTKKGLPYILPWIYFGCPRIKGLPDSKQPKSLEKEWIVFYAYRNPKTGRMQRIPVRGGINYEDTIEGRYAVALEVKREITEYLEEGGNPFLEKSQQVKFHDALDMAFDAKVKRKKLKDVTITNYKWWLDILKEYTLKFKDFPIQSITLMIISHALQKMQDEREFGNARYNNYKIFIEELFKFMVNLGIIKSSPVAGMLPKIAEKPTKYQDFTEDEIDRIKVHLKEKNINFYRYWMVFSATGIRPYEEMLSLKVKDYHPELGIKIHDEAAKAGVSRWAAVTDQCKEILDEMNLNECDPEWYIFGWKFRPGPRNTAGNAVNYQWRMYIDSNPKENPESIGIRKKMYGMKHTMAARMRKSGLTKGAIKTVLGHASEKMSARYIRESELEAQATELQVIKKSMPKV